MKKRSIPRGMKKIANRVRVLILRGERTMGIESVLIIALVAFIVGLIVGVILSRPSLIRY